MGLYVPTWQTWLTSIIPVFKKLRWEDGYKIKASLGYIRRCKLDETLSERPGGGVAVALQEDYERSGDLNLAGCGGSP